MTRSRSKDQSNANKNNQAMAAPIETKKQSSINKNTKQG